MNILRTLLAVTLLQAGAARNVTQSIEGVVVDRLTSAPIAGMRLQLMGIVRDRFVSYRAKSGRDGSFAFTDIRPSAGYSLSAVDPSKPPAYGQIGVNGGPAPIPVAAGEHVRDLQVRLLPTGTIEGRVLNEDGKPMRDMQVLAMRPIYRGGVRTLAGVASFVETNKRGEYRIAGLAPGLYYIRVAASYRSLAFLEGPSHDTFLRMRSAFAVPIVESETEGYPFYYFPGTDEEQAQAVELRVGATASGIDVVVREVRTHRVRGTILDSQTGLVTGPAKMLLVRRNAEPGRWPARTLETRNGTFDLRNVPPGSYFLTATTDEENASKRGRVALDVGASDMSGLTVTVASGFNLNGTIRIDGPFSAADLSGVTATLVPDPPSSSPTSAAPVPSESRGVSIPPIRSTSTNGRIELRGITLWAYHVEVSHFLPDGYVKSVRLGTTDILAGGLKADDALTGELEIVLGRGAGIVDGVAVDAAGKAAANAQVVLVPDSAARARRDLYQVSTTDDLGHYEIRNVPPGEFKLFAWECVANELWLDTDFLGLYEENGIPLHIEEGSRQTMNLPTIPEWY